MKRWSAAAMVLAVAMVGVAAWHSALAADDREKDPAKQPPKIGEAAPVFDLKDADGKSVKLSDFKGKIVVLHWQSVHCPWDNGYQPVLNKIAQKYAKVKNDKGEEVERLVFIGINSNKNESYDDIKAYRKSTPIAYKVLKDPGNVVADQYHARTTPHIYIIDQQGILRYKGGVEKAPDSPNEIGKSKEQYLAPSLDNLFAGRPIDPTVTESIGCGIKREEKK